MGEKKKKVPMFQQMADEISDAVAAIVKKYTPEIKRRRKSPHLTGFWISEGARKGADKTIYLHSKWKRM